MSIKQNYIKFGLIELTLRKSQNPSQISKNHFFTSSGQTTLSNSLKDFKHNPIKLECNKEI